MTRRILHCGLMLFLMAASTFAGQEKTPTLQEICNFKNTVQQEKRTADRKLLYALREVTLFPMEFSLGDGKPSDELTKMGADFIDALKAKLKTVELSHINPPNIIVQFEPDPYRKKIPSTMGFDHPNIVVRCEVDPIYGAKIAVVSVSIYEWARLARNGKGIWLNSYVTRYSFVVNEKNLKTDLRAALDLLAREFCEDAGKANRG